MSRSLILPLAALTITALTLAGCGRKGDLDVPGAAPVERGAKQDEKPQVEDRPFVLDPLL